jgi:chemotaxis protein methyltransferase CheR
MPLAKTREEYEVFRQFLQDACGILLGDNKDYLIDSRLKGICDRFAIASLGELVQRMRASGGAPLRESVVDAMTTNETLWFRDAYPFQIFKERLLKESEERVRGSRPVLIWSAACSTGQEPYSIAISADEARAEYKARLSSGIRIIATDISSTALNLASRGVYELLALGRGMSEERLRRHFNQLNDQQWQVKPTISQMVEFRSLNLMESYARLGQKFDIIFCRNVLIYFSPTLKQDILRRMHEVLIPGGYLVLGASESLSNLRGCYDMVQCSPGIVYKAK